LGWYGTTVAGDSHSCQQFFAVVGFAFAIFFHDGQAEFDVFVGGKAPGADTAFAPSADGFAIVDFAGINDIGFLVMAKGTTHRPTLLSQGAGGGL